MHSDILDVAVVVDSETVGQSSAEVLRKSGAPDVPIVPSVTEAPEAEVIIIGAAPAGEQIPDTWIGGIEDAIRDGCDVISGLHVLLGDDDERANLATEHDARVFDIGKPPGEESLRVGDGFQKRHGLLGGPFEGNFGSPFDRQGRF